MATVTKPIALDESFHTTETPSRNIADVLASLGDAISQGAQPVTKKLATNSFKTINGGLVDGLTVQFTPVQDLHGQSKPWAGGAGKNILPMTVDTVKSLNGGSSAWINNKRTIEGVEFEILVDADNNVTGIKVDRKSSSANHALLALAYQDFSFLTASTSYTLNGCPSGGSNTSYALVYQAVAGTTYWDEGNGATFTFTGTVTDATLVRLVIRSSYSPSNMVFKPMIRFASVADPTFEPYSNICPISGHTEAKAKINDTVYTTSLGGTYYGGEIDMVSGEGEVKYATLTLDGTEAWGHPSSWTKTYGFILAGALASATPVSGYATVADIKCDYAPTITPAQVGSDTYLGVAQGGGDTLYLAVSPDIDTVAKLKTWLGNNNVTVSYPLAAPTTLTLTGQNITADVGINNVSAPLTGQSIKTDSVIYKDMFTWEDVLKVI